MTFCNSNVNVQKSQPILGRGRHCNKQNLNFEYFSKWTIPANCKKDDSQNGMVVLFMSKRSREKKKKQKRTKVNHENNNRRLLIRNFCISLLSFKNTGQFKDQQE